MVQFKKIRVGKLFSIKPTKHYDLTNEYLFDGGGLSPVVTNSESNNGITGWTSRKPTMPGGMITYSDTTSENSIFYQPKPFVGYSHIQGLTPLDDSIGWSRESLLYFLTAFRKASAGRYSYGSKFNRKKALDELVVLPVTDSGQLDVQYMEQYIKRVEADYIKRVEAYLATLGYESLDDCELSSQDLKVLSGPDEWGKFRIGSLFKKLSSRYLGSGNKFDAVRKKPSAEFSLPVTYAKYNNNGIMYWGRPADFQHYRNCISVIYNGAVSAGLVFAQKDDTGVLAESYLIDFKSYHNESFEVDLYISAVMKKALYPLYSRENLAVWSKVKDNMIKLPVTPDGKPDYDFMDQYITAIEKKKVLKLKQAMDHKLDLYREMSHQD